MLACQKGNVEVVRCILTIGDPNTSVASLTGETAFDYAVMNGHYFISRLAQEAERKMVNTGVDHACVVEEVCAFGLILDIRNTGLFYIISRVSCRREGSLDGFEW